MADLLSKLNRAEDYYIPRLKALGIMKNQDITASSDVSTTRSNRVVQRNCSPRLNSRVVARDGLKINLNKELAWIHCPIPLIGSYLNKIKEEQVQLAIIIIPTWTSQFWSHLFNQLTVKRQEICLFSTNSYQVKDQFDFASVRQDSQHKQFIVQQNLGKHNGEDTHMMLHVLIANLISYLESKGLSHHAIKEARISSSILFNNAGIKLEQGLTSSIMRQHYRESAKIQNDEAMLGLDILQNHIRKYAKKPSQTLSVIYNCYSVLLTDNCMSFTTMIYKGNQGMVDISLHQIKGDESYPIFWGSATREDCSFRIRQLLFEAGIPKPVRVTDIRTAALTKLISNSVTKEEADRWSRHSQSAETVRGSYDRNNNQYTREPIAESFNEVSPVGRKLPRRGAQLHIYINSCGLPIIHEQTADVSYLGGRLPLEGGASDPREECIQEPKPDCAHPKISASTTICPCLADE
ncbi:MAG: hypothetical protein EZS28_019036 [Streblomastix strix]|uniref:Tyr recombinase domain-containing protein n=1 Tax=Streblomastix strix TaxID=222440 RepID=A0A5J4VSN5_9EUKA|nr:MAG: hypothetical protein EZS28_019036 [Streblomastix strix]